MAPDFDRLFDLQRKISETIDREQDRVDESIFDGLFLDEDTETPVPEKKKRGRPPGKSSKPKAVLESKEKPFTEVLIRLEEAIARLGRD